MTVPPNMATMLCFVTTDCAISVPMLQKAIKAAADTTFNMISVDGDTSTNDTLAIMANGEAENEEIVDIVRGMSVSLEELPLVLQRLRDGGTSGQSVQKSEPAEKEEN